MINEEDFMADDFNLVLEHLRHIRGKVDHLDEGQKRIEQRLTAMDRHAVADRLDAANTREELDAVRSRLDRIERRLELNEPEH
jgi:hypothetical protein